jgi:glycosyltransferase involved in cell wall biosynthesis
MGGVPAYVAGLAEGLVQRGWRITVLAPPRTSVDDRLRRSGAQILRLDMAHSPAPTDARAIGTLARACRQGGADLVHGHSTKAGFLAALGARMARVPSVYTPNAWPFQGKGRVLQAAYGRFEGLLGRRLHHTIIAVSESERQLGLARGIRPRGGIRVVHTGLPRSRLPGRERARAVLGLTEGELVAAWVGRCHPQKRPGDLAPLARLLRPEGVTLVALGKGLADSPEGEAARVAGAHLLPEGHEPGAVYVAADIFVQTSAWEGFSLAVLEAMAAGLPVVAYAAGGLAEQVVQGRTGYLVEPGDVDGLAARVVELGRTQWTLARAGAAGRAVVDRRFSYEQMLQGIEDVYERATLGDT